MNTQKAQIYSPEEIKRAYQREWRKKNKDKVKAINDRYWAKKAAQMQNAQN